MSLTFVDVRTGERIALDRTEIWPEDGVIDALGAIGEQNTASHYEAQWGPGIGFQDFARANPEAMAVTPGRQLGWNEFLRQVREAGQIRPTTIYDAGCGFGGVLDSLFSDPCPANLVYLGTDIHGALAKIRRPTGASRRQIHLLRWDVSEPPPIAERFDFVVCRATIHHTPDPRRTFAALAACLKNGGEIAISAYAKKARIREAVDTALRNEIAAMSNDKALEVANEFTVLGQALRLIRDEVVIERDLEWLGIKAGSYRVQSLIYEHMLKCFYNEAFGRKYSDVVNFDWYHPTFAYRYDLDELLAWFADEGVDVAGTASTAAQHFVRGRKG